MVGVEVDADAVAAVGQPQGGTRHQDVWLLVRDPAANAGEAVLGRRADVATRAAIGAVALQVDAQVAAGAQADGGAVQQDGP